jgi:hypothetical protein
MAIQVDLATSQYGIPFAGAYFRIVTAAVSRMRNPDIRFYVMIDVAGYASVPQHEDTREVEFRRYNVRIEDIEVQSGDNFLSRCYQWVMAQPDMTGSVAV